MDPVFNKKYRFVDNCFTSRIFKGLDEDLALLYREFKQTGNSSFSSFAAVWRELKFASIFADRYMPAEALEFTEGLLHFSKGYLFSFDLTAVVFGIYLVYAIYYKQPLQEKRSRLRLTKNEFKEMREQFLKLQEGNFNDAADIYVYMVRHSMIIFAATPMQAGLEIGFRKYLEGVDVRDSGSQDPLQDAFDPEILNSYQNVLQLYNEKKAQVLGDSSTITDNSDFLEQMRKKLQTFGTSQTIPVSTGQKSVSENHDSLRRSIKHRAFTSGATVSVSAEPPLRPPKAVVRKKEIKMEVKSEQETQVEEEISDAELDRHDFEANIFD